MNKIESYGNIYEENKVKKLKIVKRNAFLEAIQTLSKGRYRVVIEKIYNKRSTPQNAYLWGVIYPILIRGFQDMGWRDIKTDEQAHSFCKERFLKVDIFNENTGDKWQIINSTTKLTTIEFNEYIEDIKEFGTEFLNIKCFPGPNEEMQELKL